MHTTTATVCRYVVDTLKMRSRAMAEKLGIHHTTWLRYLRGNRRPPMDIKQKLVALMKVQDFHELIRLAFRYHFNTLKN